MEAKRGQHGEEEVVGRRGEADAEEEEEEVKRGMGAGGSGIDSEAAR